MEPYLHYTEIKTYQRFPGRYGRQIDLLMLKTHHQPQWFLDTIRYGDRSLTSRDEPYTSHYRTKSAELHTTSRYLFNSS